MNPSSHLHHTHTICIFICNTHTTPTHAHSQVKELEQELEEVKATLDGVKAQLEAETLSKVDLQNNIQSLREDMAFKKKMYEEVGAFMCCRHEAVMEQLALSKGTMQTAFNCVVPLKFIGWVWV